MKVTFSFCERGLLFLYLATTAIIYVDTFSPKQLVEVAFLLGNYLISTRLLSTIDVFYS